MGTQEVKLERAGEKTAVDGMDPFVHLFIICDRLQEKGLRRKNLLYVMGC